MAAAATIVANSTLRVHMSLSSGGLPWIQSTLRILRDVPVDSFKAVGLDRPGSSEWPYLELLPELEEPDAPEPDELELAAPEPAPVPAPGPAAPSPPVLQPLAVHCGSLGFSFAHAGLVEPLLLLFEEPLVDELVELLSLFAIVMPLSFDEVEPDVPLMPEELLFDLSVLEEP